jgi:hypothetical protein
MSQSDLNITSPNIIKKQEYSNQIPLIGSSNTQNA